MNVKHTTAYRSALVSLCLGLALATTACVGDDANEAAPTLPDPVELEVLGPQEARGRAVQEIGPDNVDAEYEKLLAEIEQDDQG